MKRKVMFTIALILMIVGVAAVAALPAVAAPPDEAHVHFGDHTAGPPLDGGGNGQWYHAVDKMVPRTAVIAEGGHVTFDISPLHQIAIYKPGTNPEDIDLTQLDDLVVSCDLLPPDYGGPCPLVVPDFIIADADDRVALSPALHPFLHQEWTTPEGIFDEPGRYLVICTTLPHFMEADMYGWVNVQ